MPLNQKDSRQIFQKLSRQLDKLGSKPAPESVHKFRTYGRRVEALLTECCPKLKRNEKKLLKLLTRLRDRAGKVRDLDVQIAALRNLKIPEAARQKAQLSRALSEDRLRRERKLESSFDKAALRDLRKRLKRAAAETSISSGEALNAALRLLAKLPSDHSPLTEKVLHQYRIAGKRARYLAELAGKNPEATRLVRELKRMQDVIGDWHDWWKLTERAENLFGEVQASPLVAALRNVTRAKFRQAVEVLGQTQAELRGKRPVTMISQERKSPAPQATKTTAAVA